MTLFRREVPGSSKHQAKHQPVAVAAHHSNPQLPLGVSSVAPEPGEGSLLKQCSAKQQQHGLPDAAARLGPELHAAGVFAARLSSYLESCHAAGARGSLCLLWVRLTIACVTTNLRACAVALGNFIASVPGQGCILVLDESPDEREHLHGFLLVENRERSRDEWLRLTHADARAQSFEFVYFSDPRAKFGAPSSWVASENPNLGENILNRAEYAFRLKYAGPGLEQRVVTATGAFSGPWEAARASLALFPAPPTVPPQNPSARPRKASVCAWCGDDLAKKHKRSHSRYCDHVCQQAAYEARRAEKFFTFASDRKVKRLPDVRVVLAVRNALLRGAPAAAKVIANQLKITEGAAALALDEIRAEFGLARDVPHGR